MKKSRSFSKEMEWTRHVQPEEPFRRAPRQYDARETGLTQGANILEPAVPNGAGTTAPYAAHRPGPYKRPSDEPLDNDRRPTANPNRLRYDDIDNIPHRASPCRSPLITPNTSFTSKYTTTTRESFASSFPATDESSTSISSQESLSQSSTYKQDGVIILPDRPPTTIESRLERVWPKLPETLNHAPLGIVWEITRAAAHCNVDTAGFDLKYESNESNESWHNQTKLRGQLATHSSLFRGKGLPPPSSDAAWKAALGNFKSESRAKVVVLSLELTECSRPTEPFYKAKLNPLQFRLGHRLDRRWGSDRLLEVSIPTLAPSKSGPEAEAGKQKARTVIQWLCTRTHYFVGRHWVPFFTRPDKKQIKNRNKNNNPNQPEEPETQYLEQVYFFATGGNNFMNPGPTWIPPQEEKLHERTNLSIDGLFEWMLSGVKSGAQPVPKLFSRIALSLSRTVPTVTLKHDQIVRPETDLLSPKPHGKVMNDGIGRMSRSLARKVADELGLIVAPCAYQGRIGSAKGMWIVDLSGDETDDEDWIELFPSQIKWECDFQDPQHLTFEVKSWPRKLVSSALNQQFIPILETQAPTPKKKLAMREAMAKHLKQGLDEDLELAKASLHSPAHLSLWIERHARNIVRLDGGHVPFMGGLPDQHEDRVPFLVNSGFQPQTNALLRSLVEGLIEKRTQILKKKWNIQIPCSTTALIVVDFMGKLKHDEVHLSFSSNFEVDGFSDTLLEDRYVLVARSPSHFPSDIQKVKVVSLPHLRKLKDVIVFPVTGKRALADLLSGGDYDGDRAWICWDPDIVDNFENALPPPDYDFVQEGYLRKTTTANFGHLVRKHQDVSKAYDEFRKIGFEFNMQGSLLGICTKYKEKLCYHGHPTDGEKSIMLSVLLSSLVDQAKAGLEFTKDDWKRFKRERLQAPHSFEDPLYDQDDVRCDENRNNHAPFMHILDYLKFCIAIPLINDVGKEIKLTINKVKTKHADKDLTKLAEETDLCADNGSAIFKELRRCLQNDLRCLHKEWGVMASRQPDDIPFSSIVEELHEKWLQISPAMPSDGGPAPPELELLLRFNWASPEALTSTRQGQDRGGWDSPYTWWALFKASWTYKMFHEKKDFPWHMAGKQLAIIKANAVSSAPQWRQTAPVFVVPSQYSILRTDKKLAARQAMLTGIRDNESLLALDEVADYDDNGGVVDDL